MYFNQHIDETTVRITRSKKGIPCMNECGGGNSNTGDAQIITDGGGYPKRAIHIFTRGVLACADHAVIPVREGDHIVTVNRHHDQVAIKVDRIVSIQEDTAEVEPETAPIAFGAIVAAVEKSRDYHCREPYYISNLGGKEDE